MPTRVVIEPSFVEVEEPVLEDLRERLRRTRFPDAIPGVGWEQGVDLEYLQGLVADWVSYDWRSAERDLNRLHHFRARVDGELVHYVHERGVGDDPFPIVLTHGWPSSFLEYVGILGPLTDPASHGGDPADAFDVVVPSLPGYGFSERPRRTGILSSTIADLWSHLMVDGLGYDRFGAHGTDIGAGVTSRLGRQHPEHVAGIHLSAPSFAIPPAPWTTPEREYIGDVASWHESEGAYSALQSTKPQTLGYALADSPAGLAAWLVEKYRSWSDCSGDVETSIPRAWILGNCTLYWVTSTITSSMRLYYDHRLFGDSLPAGRPVPVPAGFAIFANDLCPPGKPPRELAERYFTVARWSEFPIGGHFAALEEPELLVQEIRAFFRPLRG